MDKLPVVLLLLAAIVVNTTAICVHNKIRHRIKVERIEGGYTEYISPGGEECCQWSKCGGRREKVQRFEITYSSNAIQTIRCEADGCIEVIEDDTDWNWPKGSTMAEMIQSVSYHITPKQDGKCSYGSRFDYEPYINREGSRSVHFLATADPQYWIENNVKDVPHRTILTMRKLRRRGERRGENIRGIIVAGDLVQRADYWGDLYPAYLDALGGDKRYFFDGVGNHDIDPKDGYWSRIKEILTEIGDRKRVAVTNMRGGYGGNVPDYSWNWDDVHFVQMHDYPGSEGQLSWLKQDLAENVGASGNPVVMVHHYGFDGFSRGWWTHDERKTYWNIIKGYNVIAFFTGHLHTPPALLQYWEGEPFLEGKRIPFFIAGAANQDGGGGRGFFLEVRITESEMVIQRRYGNDGSLAEEVSVPLKPTKATLLRAGGFPDEKGKNDSGSMRTTTPYI